MAIFAEAIFNMKKTIVIGASTKTDRYSHMAVNRLKAYGHEVVALGIKEGMIGEVSIRIDKPELNDVDTVTLYLNPLAQKDWYEYILRTKPTRIIFNPGTENFELATLAASNGIQTTEACTLVLLSTNQY